MLLFSTFLFLSLPSFSVFRHAKQGKLRSDRNRGKIFYFIFFSGCFFNHSFHILFWLVVRGESHTAPSAKSTLPDSLGKILFQWHNDIIMVALIGTRILHTLSEVTREIDV